MPLNFTFLPWIDTYDLACSLRGKAHLFGDSESGIRRLSLRGPKKGAEDPDDVDAYVRSSHANKWPELRATLNHIEQIGSAIVKGPIDFGRIYFEWLDPGAVIPWRRLSGPYAERFFRHHLPVRTNPGAMLYSGTEAVQALPGQLVQINVRVPHSALNMGDTPRIHLVLDVTRRTEAPARSHDAEAPEAA